MKIFTLSPGEGWIVDRIVSEWKSFFPEYNTENPYEADILWLAAGWCWKNVPMALLSSKKIVVTIHHEVPAKFNQQKKSDFLARDKFVDVYHVPSIKTAEFISSFTSKPIKIISYWYNANNWYPIDKKTSRKELGLDDYKFIIGSFQRDTEGHDLITPKLEKGPDIFCDFVERNKGDNTLVLLGGWRRQYVISRLSKSNIDYKFIELASVDILKKMYAALDLYVVGSRHEGGPQSVFECTAMKVPIVSTDVGIVSNILHPNCIIDVKNKDYMPTKDDIEYNYKRVKKFDIKLHGKLYLDMFGELI